jgi:hypothetical protein
MQDGGRGAQGRRCRVGFPRVGQIAATWQGGILFPPLTSGCCLGYTVIGFRREHHLCRALNFWKVVRKRGEQAREHPPMGAAQVWGPEVSPVTGGRRGPQEVQSGAILLLGQWPGHRLIHSFLPLRGTGRMTPRHPSLFELALGPPSLPTAYCLS